MRDTLPLLRILLALGLPAAASPLELLLPLPGEPLDASRPAVLARAGAGASRVVFAVSGDGFRQSDTAASRGDGLFSVVFRPLPEGPATLSWTLLSADGSVVGRDSQTVSASDAGDFDALGAGAGTVGGRAARAAAPAWRQDLRLFFDGGWSEGGSDGDLRAWRELSRSGDTLVAGARVTPWDRDFDARGGFAWRARRGDLRLSLGGTADLGDRDGRTAALHRASFEAGWGSWASLRLGDQNPSWDPLLFDRSRLRGAGATLAWAPGGRQSLRLDGVVAERSRAVRPALLDYGDSLPDTVAGRWARDLFALGLTAGTPGTFTWSATFLRGRDDRSSLDAALQDSLGGDPAAANAALGTELRAWLWGRRLELWAQGAASLVTEDASLGTLDAEAQDDLGVSGLDGFSFLVPINSTTRGTEVFLADRVGPAQVGDFVARNAAARAGLRWAQPLAGGSRMVNEIRFTHAGLDFESFARATRERARTGFEVSHGSGWAGERLHLSASAGFYDRHREGDDDIAETDLQGVLAFVPRGAAPGFQFSGSRGSSEDGDDDLLSRSASAGIFQTFRGSGSRRLTTGIDLGWSDVATESELSDSVTKAATERGTTSAWLRWSPSRSLELRTRHGFGRARDRADGADPVSALEHDHSAGATWKGWRRRLELGADGRAALRDDEPGADWTQSSWASLEGAGHSLRLSERLRLPRETRHDFALGLSWEYAP